MPRLQLPRPLPRTALAPVTLAKAARIRTTLVPVTLAKAARIRTTLVPVTLAKAARIRTTLVRVTLAKAARIRATLTNAMAVGATLVTAFLGAALVTASPAAAQNVHSDAERAVLEAVQRIFAGMNEADSAKVRSVFAEGARFAAVVRVDGVEIVRFQPVDGWIQAIAGSGGTWEERIYDVEVRVDDDMAIVWAPYTFLRSGEISHCGINSIALLRTGERWLVTQISDTRRRGECRER